MGSEKIRQRAVKTYLTVALFLMIVFAMAMTGGKVSAFCFDEAAEQYSIPADILRAIAKVESGLNPTALNINRDGTYDYGVMQINSSWHRVLGEALWGSLDEPCINIQVGAWILAKCLEKHGKVWESVGCYNASGKKKRTAYVRKVMQALNRQGQKDLNFR